MQSKGTIDRMGKNEIIMVEVLMETWNALGGEVYGVLEILNNASSDIKSKSD